MSISDNFSIRFSTIPFHLKIRARTKFKHWQLDECGDWKSDQTHFWMPAVVLRRSLFNMAQLIVALLLLLLLLWLLFCLAVRCSFIYKTVDSSISWICFPHQTGKKSIIIFSWSGWYSFFIGCCALSRLDVFTTATASKAETIRLTCRRINRIHIQTFCWKIQKYPFLVSKSDKIIWIRSVCCPPVYFVYSVDFWA